jgi:predicted MFS family arabinose efflux permease
MWTSVSPWLMGTMESVCGLGFVAGPAIGGILYDSTSFFYTLFLPSAVLIVYTLLPAFLLHEPKVRRCRVTLSNPH